MMADGEKEERKGEEEEEEEVVVVVVAVVVVGGGGCGGLIWPCVSEWADQVSGVFLVSRLAAAVYQLRAGELARLRRVAGTPTTDALKEEEREKGRKN
jgi:hypothetical protein